MSRSTSEFAKRLRRRTTSSEKLLWKQIRGRNITGAKFRRQHPIGRYIADFYCHESRLVVEVDGPIHLKPDRLEHDRNRDAEMKRLGLTIMRFTNQEIKTNISSVLRKIKEEVERGRQEGE